MSKIFVVFDPSALPIAKPGLPCNADSADTNNSGAEVPKPSTTIPITNFDICKCWARCNALSVNWSALHIRSENPTIKAAINKSISC